jgi:hypothetical protein
MMRHGIRCPADPAWLADKLAAFQHILNKFCTPVAAAPSSTGRSTARRRQSLGEFLERCVSSFPKERTNGISGSVPGIANLDGWELTAVA